MNRRNALKKIATGATIGLPITMFTAANVQASLSPSDDPHAHNMGNVDTDPDYWTAERVHDHMRSCTVDDANGNQIRPDACVITWFNTRTGWVGELDRSRILNGERPVHSVRYPAPLRIRPL